MDVVRVLAAVLLLGNIQFDDNQLSNLNQESFDSQHSFKREIQAVANLLGVSSAILYKGFTTLTYHGAKGQTVKSQRTVEHVSFYLKF